MEIEQMRAIRLAPNLDPNQMKNYRPVLNLPFLSKILEKKVVLMQLTNHLTSNHLTNKFQSAYRAVSFVLSPRREAGDV